MPPRKSDQPRKSDVSVARFMPMDEDTAETPAIASSVAAAATEPEGAPSLPVSPRKEAEKKESQKDKDKERDTITIEDLTLPKSIITRLAKGVLPPNTQIQGNATLAMSKSAVLFVNYLASHANEHAQSANKKTIMPADVFKALDDIEFPFLTEALQAEFSKYNDIQTAKRTSYRQKVAAAKKAASGSNADTSTLTAAADETEVEDTSRPTTAAESAPKAKKAKVDTSTMEVDEEADDAETEPEDEQAEEEDDAEEDEDEEESSSGTDGEETQDALEERETQGEADEALDGSDSD